MTPLKKLPLLAVAMLLGSAWMAGDAQAHPYWPKDIDMVKRSDGRYITFTVIPAPGLSIGESGQHVKDIGLNWCKPAKGVKLVEADIAAKRAELSRIKECNNVAYQSLGHNYKTNLWGQDVVGDHEIKIDESALSCCWHGNQFIISVNFWTGSTHHHGWGSHTTLKLVTE